MSAHRGPIAEREHREMLEQLAEALAERDAARAEVEELLRRISDWKIAGALGRPSMEADATWELLTAAQKIGADHEA